LLLGHDDFLSDDQAPWLGLLSYNCSYDIHTFEPNSIALASRTYPDFAIDLSQWSDWCRVWDVPDLSARLSVDVSSPVPVLMFRGDLSPNGDGEWMRTLLRGFPNGQALVFPTLGDDLLETGPPCLSDLRRQFLSDPTTRLDTNACVAQSPPIQFTAPG
jgi:hypothetical protein